MESSILNTIKKMLGVEPEDDSFDEEITNHINGAFYNLWQLGIGPKNGFLINGSETKWSDYSDNQCIIAALKPYIQSKVRLLFDPPSNSFVTESIKNNISELEWRLNVQAEGVFDD